MFTKVKVEHGYKDRSKPDPKLDMNALCQKYPYGLTWIFLTVWMVYLFCSLSAVTHLCQPDLNLGQFIVPSQQVPVLIAEIIQSKRRSSGLKGKD